MSKLDIIAVFGCNLYIIRLNKGLSLDDLETCTGICTADIKEMERGKRI